MIGLLLGYDACYCGGGWLLSEGYETISNDEAKKQRYLLVWGYLFGSSRVAVMANYRDTTGNDA